MDIPPIAYMPFLIAIVAVVMGVGSKMLKVWAYHQQEMARIRASQGTVNVGSDSAALEQLRREVMQLRDTTTQYDMSVERTLQDIKNRLAFIESGRELTPRAVMAPDIHEQTEVQQVGLGS